MMTGSGPKPKPPPSATILVLFWLLAAGVFLAGPVRVGFLSDDFDLINAAATRPWYGALERHHAATILTPLFKATAAGIIGRPTWLLLAFLAHAANIALVWAILTRRLGAPPVQAWTITALFTLCPAGFEALAWAGCLGYVLVTSVILLAVWVALSPPPPEASPETALRYTPWVFALLQIVALLVWDWGALLAPTAALCWFYTRRRGATPSATARDAWRALWPVAAAWLVCMIVRAGSGHAIGYGVAFDPTRSARILLSAPYRGLYANSPSALAPLGLLLRIAAVALLVGFAAVDRQVRLLAAIFLLCQLPYALLVTPESRYFYVGSFFLYGAAVLPTRYIPRHSIQLGLCILLVGVNAFWSIQRARWWEGAYRQAQGIKLAIEQVAAGESSSVVVVNLPDRYGPPELFWKPYMWRNGWTGFSRPFTPVNTPDVEFTWPGAPIPVMSRQQVQAKYPDRAILEVTYRRPGDWREFAVVKLARGTQP